MPSLRYAAARGGLLLPPLRPEPPTGLPTGETTPVVFQEDENGMVKVTPEYLEEFFPTLTCIDFGTTTQTSDNIDDYLVDSFQMAQLVSSRGAESAVGDYGMYNAGNDSNNRVALLLFDGNTHLMGYFISSPTSLGNGKWQMDVVSCDYDFTELYEKELAAFEGSWEDDFSTYIPSEEIASSGAVWFLKGYNTGKGPVLREDDAQIYALWHTLHGPELERQCREIERLAEFLPNEGRWMCYRCWTGTTTCWATPCWTTRETEDKRWNTNAPTAAHLCRRNPPSAPTAPPTFTPGNRQKRPHPC